MIKNKRLSCDLSVIGINLKFHFYVFNGDLGVSKQLERYGFREPLNSYYYYSFIDENDIVLDIGANLGYFTLLSKNAKRIISVEPIKECIPILKKNIEENGLGSKTKIINMAVGKKEGLFIKKNPQINLSKVVKKKEKDVRKIKSEPLKYFIKKYGANTLRMDVEGYEYELLYKKIPKKVRKISLEAHPNIIGLKKFKQLINYLEKEGFIVKHFIEPFTEKFYPYYLLMRVTGLRKLVSSVISDIKPNNFLHVYQKGNCLLTKIYSKKEILNRRYIYLMLERR